MWLLLLRKQWYSSRATLVPELYDQTLGCLLEEGRGAGQKLNDNGTARYEYRYRNEMRVDLLFGVCPSHRQLSPWTGLLATRRVHARTSVLPSSTGIIQYRTETKQPTHPAKN